MWTIFLSALVVGYSGAIMPGPMLTYCMQRSLKDGPKAGFLLVAGHALLEVLVVILLSLGLGTILQSNPAQITIGCLGGALLLWMGGGMVLDALRNRVSIQVESAQDRKSMGSLVLSGVVLSATNPYFILWWAMVGTGMMTSAYAAAGFAGVAVFYLGHILSDATWYGFVSILLGTTRRFIKPMLYRGIIVALGAVLLYFGGKYLVDAITLWVR